MKKKFVSIMLCVCLMVSVAPVSAQAVDVQSTKYADGLYELGLFRGTGTDDKGKPLYELERTATRAEALVMLIRLLGEEESALAYTGSQPFSDMGSAQWADRYVAYAQKMGYTKGTGDGTTFSPIADANSLMYLTFLLRSLGYDESKGDFNYNAADKKAVAVGLCEKGEYPVGIAFTRGDCASAGWRALTLLCRDGQGTLAERLVQSGAIDEAAATRLSVLGESGVYRADSFNNKVHIEYLAAAPGTVKAAAYGANGGLLASSEALVSSGFGSLELRMSGLPESYTLRAHYENADGIPVGQILTDTHSASDCRVLGAERSGNTVSVFCHSPRGAELQLRVAEALSRNRAFNVKSEKTAVLAGGYSRTDYEFGELSGSCYVEAVISPPGGYPDFNAGLYFSLSCEGEMSGQCGENVFWSFDAPSGTLSISGTGKMYDAFETISLGTSWAAYRYAVSRAVIGGGVTMLSPNAFSQCVNLVSVSFADSVEQIWPNAFEECRSLRSVRLPSKLTYLSNCAFACCRGLERIILPETTKWVYERTFFECTKLAEVTLPAKAPEIQEEVFASTPWGKAQGDFYVYYDGTLLTYQGSAERPSIPSNVLRLGTSCFKSNHTMTDIVIPSSVRAIGTHAFQYSDVENITVSAGVKYIETEAFSMSELETITLPGTVESVGASAFFYDRKLVSVELGDGIKRIEENAFLACENLKRLVIPASVTEIEPGAFGYEHAYRMDGTVLDKKFEDVVIVGVPGSEAERYARDNGIAFEAMP